MHEIGDARDEQATWPKPLQEARAPLPTVRATFRFWRDLKRSALALRRGLEEERRCGASFVKIGVSDPPAGPSGSEAGGEIEEILRVGRTGDKFREERQGGPRDGSYGVRRGNLWWSWDPRNGAFSNEDNPEVSGGVGEDVSILLDPAPVLSALSVRVIGRSEVAGRVAITAEGVPHPRGPAGPARWIALYRLGTGAERYALQIDAEFGVLLAAIAFHRGHAFRQITTTDITFDEPIDDETFLFHPPAGQEIQHVGEAFRPQFLTPAEAERLAGFAVLIPTPVDPNWHLDCVFNGRSDRPPFPAQVTVNYRSDDGSANVSLLQFAADDRPAVYDEVTVGDRWRDEIRNGTLIRVTKPGTASPQAQAHLEREGTFVFLTSETLSHDQLATLAAGLEPITSSS